MNESTEDIVLIEQYLEGSLSDQEKQDFELRLETDEDFNRLLDEYAVLIAGIKFSGREKILANFQNIESELENETKVVKMTPSKNKTWYYVAASIALLFVAFFLLKPNNELSGSELALAYFEPYPATIGAASRSTETSKDLIERAMSSYENGDYETTIEILEGLGENNTDINKFYLGNAYQATQAYDKAIKIYQDLIDNSQMFNEQASFNLALCYLSTDNIEGATTLLKNANFAVPAYQDKAGQLLEKLE